jgi:hypothetical protein
MWIAGVIVLAAGLVMGGVCISLMLAYGGHFTAAPNGNGYDFVPSLSALFWTMVTLIVIGFAVAAVGAVIQLAAWIGALVNTYQLTDKTWFLILLIGGLLGLSFGITGFAAMVAYLIAGQDGLAADKRRYRPARALEPSRPSGDGSSLVQLRF